MRTTSLAVSGLLIAAISLSAAEKDTALAAKTRKKLQVKVTVDFKDEHIDECIKEISRQLEEANAGSLSAFYDIGVSRNQRLSYSGKSQSVADVLDGMLKKNSLGYFVFSKDKDRYDGWIKIKQGTERGWPAGEEPKGKAAAKAPDKTKAPSAGKPAAGDDDQAEKSAHSKLELARLLLKDGKTDKAKQRFEAIIRDFPKTKAAGEAKKELDKLGK